MKYVMRLKLGGLLWEAVVCSSFVFANSSNTKRSVTNPYGDTEYEQVAKGNMMADIAAFFWPSPAAEVSKCVWRTRLGP